ncbi:endonuclease/exonuclease/phosphatase family protein [Photobacterium lipolyticum]|uniref:endonuclease/exonuclease/phosphatase family protein n=1 Tax=Photobacterium lipolyticum TaxID=266810 RepID=UPI001B884533|nr:endonuclease/exonuclease/phosphatase family protein [Photobacterium lipolyticum]
MTQDITHSSNPACTIKVATFNLFNYLEPPSAFYDFDKIYSQEQWQKKQGWISRYLAEHQPDVIGFQEVFSPESLQQLVHEQGYEHFAVIDEAEVISDYIYQSPVVAIASRYPISELSAVTPDTGLAVAMGLKEGFSFSRQPLRATIQLPYIGRCDCYVVHFKSKRPMLEQDITDGSSPKSTFIAQALKTEISGNLGSAMQRGTEAALLFTNMIERRERTGYPMLLMGDFNDSLDSGVLSHLLTRSLRQRTDDESELLLAKYRLADAWDLYRATDYFQATDSFQTEFCRPATHYYYAKGSVLDYILLSCEFDAEHHASLFEVSDYHCYDRHLINPIYERDSESTDHGIVMVKLSLRG